MVRFRHRHGHSGQLFQGQHRLQIAASFGQCVPSPLEAVRGGLVLGSEPLWEKVKGCVAKSRGRAETLWTRRADPTAFVTAIEDALPQASQLKLA